MQNENDEVNSAWKNVQSRCKGYSKPSLKLRIFKYAAVFMLALSLGSYLWYFQQSDTSDTDHTDIRSVPPKAKLILATGEHFYLENMEQNISIKDLGVKISKDSVSNALYYNVDPETPLEETMEALAQIVRSGKALYVGISNYDGETMKRAADILEELHCPFIINQNSYNIFNRTIEKNGLKQAAAEKRKGIISFSPLAQGMLTDRYLNGIPKDSRVNTDGRFLHADQFSEERLNSIRSLNAIAAERGESLAQMALKWILRDGIVTSVLIGASRPQQILENLKVLDSASFSEEELKKIDECSLAL